MVKKHDKTNDYREAAERFQGKSKLVNMMFFFPNISILYLPTWSMLKAACIAVYVYFYTLHINFILYLHTL